MRLTETERQTLDARGFVIVHGRIVRHDDLPDFAAQQQANDAARAAILGRLDAAEAEERRREEERIDAQLAPRKAAERHRWLAEHPDRTGEDFEQVWREHLRPVAVAELEEAASRQTTAALAASGRYQF